MQSPENVRISNRRKKLRTIWKSKEWKEAVKNYVGDKPCQWCGGTERRTAHHPYYTSTDDVYLDLYLSGCLVLCNRCHFAIHKGLTLCPNCRQRYMRIGSTVCYSCYLLNNPDIAEQTRRRKEEVKQLKKKLRDKFKEKVKAEKDRSRK